MKHIFLISGKLRSGKNQFADYVKEIAESKGMTVNTDLFAKSLKEWCNEDFKALTDYLNDILDTTINHLKNYSNLSFNQKIQMYFESSIRRLEELITKDENWYEDKNPITRILLQTYGTEIFRKRVDQDWWVKQLKNRVLQSNSDITLITDVRFPNEIECFKKDISKDFTVTTIRINRNLNREAGFNEHESEKALDNYNEFDYVIDNNGTLEDLKNKVKELISRI